MNILLDVAMGPIYAVMGVTLLLILAVVGAVVFVAAKLIQKALKKNNKQ